MKKLISSLRFHEVTKLKVTELDFSFSQIFAKKAQSGTKIIIFSSISKSDYCFLLIICEKVDQIELHLMSPVLCLRKISLVIGSKAHG